MADGPSWYKERKYLHFDSPLSLRKATSLVNSPEKVSKHSFFPLISFNIDTYKYKKNKETNILEKTPKKRPISYAAHADSHIYKRYSEILSERYEDKLEALGLSDSVLAFRRFEEKLSNIDFARNAFSEISKRESCSAICFDVTNFFGELNHAILKSAWCYVLDSIKLPVDHYNVYKSITRYSEVDKYELYELLSISPKKKPKGIYRLCSVADFRDRVRGSGLIRVHPGSKGIPQGSPISALLSNIYMIEFDRYAKELISMVGGRYYRYCDDILCIVPIENQEEIRRTLSEKIEKYHLELHPDKTDQRVFVRNTAGVLSSAKPLQYLGFLFDGQRILLRNAALSRYSERMKSSIHLYGKAKLNRDMVRLEKGLSPTDFYRKKLYSKYGYMGRRNFLRYGYRAAKIMESTAIRKQLRPLWGRLNERIAKENDKVARILIEEASRF